MNTLNAYRLEHNVKALLESIGEDGELTPETEKLLDQLSKDKDELFGCLGRAIREHNLAAVALRGEAAWITQGARRHEDAGIRLREYMLGAMKAFGLDKVVTDIQKISVCKSPPKVEVETGLNLFEVDQTYVTMKASINADAVKQAAENGKELPPGIKIVQGEHVKISPR